MAARTASVAAAAARRAADDEAALRSLVRSGVLPRAFLRGGTCSRSRARAAWTKARKHGELCALARLFLEGRLPHFPGWGASAADTETDRLLHALACATRAGWLPVASQDGSASRRAFVLGFAAAPLAARLVRRGRRAGLRAFSYARGDASLPVLEAGWENGEAVLVVGANAFEEELDLFPATCARLLRGSRYVVLADGRRAPSRRLWRLLEELDEP